MKTKILYSSIMLLLCIALTIAGYAQIATQTSTSPAPTFLPISTFMLTEIPIIQNVEEIYDVVLSPDTKNITMYTNKGIYIFDSLTFMKRRFVELKSEIDSDYLAIHSASFPAITFSPDGSKLLFSNKNDIFSLDVLNNQENGSNIFEMSSTSRLFAAAAPEMNIFDIKYSPKGDRMMLTSSVPIERCQSRAVNFALYDMEFNLLFNQSFCTFSEPHSYENYYRFTTDNKVYIFSNFIVAGFYPVEFYKIKLSTGHVLERQVEFSYSDRSIRAQKDFIYDVSPDGRLFALGNYNENYELKTKIFDSNKRKVSQEVDGAIVFSHSGITSIYSKEGLFHHSEEILDEKCGITNQPGSPTRYIKLFSSDSKAVFVVVVQSSFLLEPFKDEIKSLELWNLSSCEIEREIVSP